MIGRKQTGVRELYFNTRIETLIGLRRRLPAGTEESLRQCLLCLAWRSAARAEAVSYRLDRSFSIALSTIRSRSPFNSR